MTGPTLCPMCRTWLADTPSSLSMGGMRSRTRPIVSGPCPPEMPASALSQVCKGQMDHGPHISSHRVVWKMNLAHTFFFLLWRGSNTFLWTQNPLSSICYRSNSHSAWHDIIWFFYVTCCCCWPQTQMSCRLTLKVVVSLQCFVVYFPFQF